MIEGKGTTGSPDPQDNHNAPETVDEINLLMSWLQQAASTSSELFDLFQLEVQLAVTDIKRLIILAKLFVPMLMLSWISLSALLTWYVYSLHASVSQGLLFLCAFQFLGLLGIVIGWKYYQKSLTLPLTRQHIRQIIKGQSSDS
jgi:uncharacterized membrane protein YqjE